MSTATLFDEDYANWTRIQADALRTLSARRDLPNDLDLDLERIAEEIEEMGRDSVGAFGSLLVQLLVHLLKLASVADDSWPSRHWRKEVRSFQMQIATRFRPSIEKHLDLHQIWRLAVRNAGEDLAEHGQRLVAVPEALPITVAELSSVSFDVDRMIERLRSSTRS